MFGSTSSVEQGKVNLCLFNLSSDLRLILKGILAPARLVTRSCALAPMNIFIDADLLSGYIWRYMN